MALSQLIPSSSSALTYKSSVNPRPTSSLNPYSSSNKLDRFCIYKSLISPSRIPSLRCSASSFSEKHHHIGKSDEFVELPLFPFPLILFPGSIRALQIFEFDHRIMMQTILQTDLRFGVLYDNFNYGTADVGCVGEVIKHERLHDDRFYIICKGQERFRISTIVRSRPYLVGKVSWMEDRPSPDGDNNLETLANDVETYMKNVIRYSNRLNGKPEADTKDLRRNMFPTPFSFFVGSTFEGDPMQQQDLLEMEDTAMRLKREKETLRNTLNYLTAASSVKDVFTAT